MGNNKIYLADWDYDGDRVKLLYQDDSILYVKRTDFDRAFGAIVSAEKKDIIRDFAIKEGGN